MIQEHGVSIGLVYYPDPRLRKMCAQVERFDAPLCDLVADMLELMVAKRGVGLAAPQVGVLRRFFVCNVTGEPADSRVYINPEIVHMAGVTEAEEGCLSIPNVNVPVRRAMKCTIRARNLEGDLFEEIAEGLLARVWQHETDHLDGVLILDRTSDAEKLAIRRTLKELERKHRPTRTAARK